MHYKIFCEQPLINRYGLVQKWAVVNLRSWFTLLCLTAFIAFAPNSYAASEIIPKKCNFSFASPLQTHGTSTSDDIYFECKAQVLNYNSEKLPTKWVTAPDSGKSCPTTCVDKHCTATGTPANSVDLGDFRTPTAKTDVTIEQNKTATIGKESNQFDNILAKENSKVTFVEQNNNAHYLIDRLTIETGAEVNLAPGTYWINSLSVKNGAIINLLDKGLVKIYTKNSFNLDKNTKVNTKNSNKNPAKQLFVYTYNTVRIADNSEFIGFIYAKRNATLEDKVKVTGAILAEEIKVRHDTTVTYDADAAKALNLAALCPDSSPIPTHFRIVNAGDALYCGTQHIQIMAMNKNEVLTGYSGTVIFNTGTDVGSWQLHTGSGYFRDNISNDGEAAYTFSPQDKGVASFLLDYRTGPSKIRLGAYDQNYPKITDDGQANQMQFSTAIFVLTHNQMYDPRIFSDSSYRYYQYYPEQPASYYRQGYNDFINFLKNMEKLDYRSLVKNDGYLSYYLNIDDYYRYYGDLAKYYDKYYKDQINRYSYKNPQTAGVPDTIYITAFGQTNALSCGIIHDYHGTKSLKFWQDYVDPDSGKLAATINELDVGRSENSAKYQNVEFTRGVAKVNMRYRDVGRIKLHVKDNESLNSIDELIKRLGYYDYRNDDNKKYSISELVKKTTLAGSTEPFVVRPAKFLIDIPNNPGATDANGRVFTAAGELFSVIVTVQDKDGNTTPNYGNERFAEGINIYSSTLVSPQNGYNGSSNLGIIGNGNVFSKISPGVFQGKNFKFDEVGIIKLTAEVASKNYLGAGNVRGPESGNVGRFTPALFSVKANTPILGTACGSGGFSYIGQSILYRVAPTITVTAMSKDNMATRNYAGKFFKISSSTITNRYSANGSASLNCAAAELDLAVTDIGNGVATVNLGDGGGINFVKTSGQQFAPFNAEIALASTITDSDGVKYQSNPFTIGSTQSGGGIKFSAGNIFYQGRVSLINNYGSDLTPLNIPMQVQYYNGVVYTSNLADSCTVFNDPTKLTVTADPSNMNSRVSVTSFNKGMGSITLSAPTPSGQTGSFNIEANLTAANLPYLQHDWPYDQNADGVFNDNPQAKGTFGIYKGQNKIIFIREVTN